MNRFRDHNQHLRATASGLLQEIAQESLPSRPRVSRQTVNTRQNEPESANNSRTAADVALLTPGASAADHNASPLTTASTLRRAPHVEDELPLYSPRTDYSEASTDTASLSSLGSPRQSTLVAWPASPAVAMDADAPPDYTIHDAHASKFDLRNALVYTSSSTSSTPRYHMSQRLTKSGRPYQLRVRRLLNSEARRLSLPTAKQSHRLHYSEEETMYIITNNYAAFGKRAGVSNIIEIKGYRASCLLGMIHMESGKSMRRGRWWRFLHVTRSVANDYLKEENESKMLKYGYKPDSEWDKQVILTVGKAPGKSYEWRDIKNLVVAKEENGGLQIETGRSGHVEKTLRDLLVTCWVAKRWMEGTVEV